MFKTAFLTCLDKEKSLKGANEIVGSSFISSEYGCGKQHAVASISRVVNGENNILHIVLQILQPLYVPAAFSNVFRYTYMLSVVFVCEVAWLCNDSVLILETSGYL